MILGGKWARGVAWGDYERGTGMGVVGLGFGGF